MQISQRGIDLIKEFEGFVAHRYDDGTGVMTIGYGTTSAEVSPLPTEVTPAEAELLLRESLAHQYEPAINALEVPLNQNQYDALCSLVYNCGPDAMQWQIGSDLRARDYAAAADDFLQYDYADGKVLAGLARRRAAERELFLTPPDSRPEPGPYVPPGPAPAPSHGLRLLRLTSPMTSGPDVATLQQACNRWLAANHEPTVTVDGVFGPLTEHAVGRVAWQMGLGHTIAMPAIQRVIEYPHLRSREDHRRAEARLAEAARHGYGLDGVIAHALSHLGVRENPANSNEGEPFPSGWERNFDTDGVPWCGCFCGSMILAAGGHVSDRVAYVPYIIADAKAGTNGFRSFVVWDGDRRQVRPGWLVTYDWSGQHSTGDHVGVVKEITPDGVIACEGNTEGSDPAAGGMVALCARSSAEIVGYCEPRF